jgi:hypothetical protein
MEIGFGRVYDWLLFLHMISAFDRRDGRDLQRLRARRGHRLADTRAVWAMTTKPT